MRKFPNAKVVLTVRDPEKWYDSVRGTIYQNVELGQGTTGAFIKLVGRSRLHNMIVSTSNQGPPSTKQGSISKLINNN